MMNSDIIHGQYGECFYCSKKSETTKDHIYPNRKGGKALAWACSLCQHSKSGMLPHLWVKEIKSSKKYSELEKEKIKDSICFLMEYYFKLFR